MDLGKVITAENSMFHKLIQVAVIVESIEKTAEKYKNVFGWEYVNSVHMTAKEGDTYYGKPGEFEATLAFYRFANIEVEIIQPTEKESIWKDHLDKYGEGMHHLLFDVPDFDAAVKALQDQGMVLAQAGQAGRYPGAQWAYFDAREQLGYFIEIFNPTQMGYQI